MTPQHSPHDPLAQQLLADAQSPSFSERLHQRTMRAVRAQQIRMALEPRSNWNQVIAAAAAVLLLGVSAWYFAGGQLPPTPQLAVQTPTLNIPDPNDLLRHSAEPLRSAISNIDDGGLAQLGQDARSLARYLANQLPQSDPRSPAKPDQRM